MALLEVDHLECGYSRGFLGPLDFAIEAGRFVLVEGPNGIGKSTLIKTLIGLLEPIDGAFRWAVDRGRLRYVPQTVTLDVMLPATVADVLATGFQRGGGWRSVRQSVDPAELDRALEAVGLAAHRRHLFRELSEGQKQLVLMARALIGDPAAILLDEPTAAMDPEREEVAVAMLAEQCHVHGRTAMLIAHGSQPARQAADVVLRIGRDRRVHLDDGQTDARVG